MYTPLFLTLALAATVRAHTAAWASGMYCKGGTVIGVDDSNTNSAVNPLYNMTQDQWWFQHYQGCDLVPPPEDEFLELPAGGTFQVELAHNRGQTTLSYGGQYASEWPDGQPHPENWSGNPLDGEGCIQDDGAMHVQNQSMATGTAFAISYESDISAVTMENLVVFTVREHTPWKRITSYDVPNLPACPVGGCTCAWLWVPHGCGIPNMYMQGFKCNVTGATSTTGIAPAQPPIYCGDDSTKCVPGAKQMIAWNQADGVNVFPPNGISPGYNAGMGWQPGAQSDIFVAGSSTTSSPSVVASSTTSVSTTATSSSAAAPTTTSSNSASSAPAVRPISTTPLSSLPLSTLSASQSSSFKPTTLLTSATPVAPVTSASIIPTTSYGTTSASSTSSTTTSPVGTSTTFPDFVKFFEAAWASWLASQGGSA